MNYTHRYNLSQHAIRSVGTNKENTIRPSRNGGFLFFQIKRLAQENEAGTTKLQGLVIHMLSKKCLTVHSAVCYSYSMLNKGNNSE